MNGLVKKVCLRIFWLLSGRIGQVHLTCAIVAGRLGRRLGARRRWRRRWQVSAAPAVCGQLEMLSLSSGEPRRHKRKAGDFSVSCGRALFACLVCVPLSLLLYLILPPSLYLIPRDSFNTKLTWASWPIWNDGSWMALNSAYSFAFYSFHTLTYTNKLFSYQYLVASTFILINNIAYYYYYSCCC